MKPVQTIQAMMQKPTAQKIAVPAVQMPRTVAPPMVQTPQPTQTPIGTVSHFYSHLSVAIIALTDTLRVGDTIHIKGHTTNFTQTIESMQIDHQSVAEAHAGKVIGLRVREHARDGDAVYKIG